MQDVIGSAQRGPHRSSITHVAFGAPYPGKIIAIHLAEVGGVLIAQKDSFLAAAKGVSVGIEFQRKLGVGCPAFDVNAACAGFAPRRQLSGRSGQTSQQPLWCAHSAGMR